MQRMTEKREGEKNDFRGKRLHGFRDFSAGNRGEISGNGNRNGNDFGGQKSAGSAIEMAPPLI